MDKVLKLYKLIDGGEQPFPSSDEQIITSDFTYTAKRMGGAPSITCTIRHKDSLEKLWSDSVYCYFNEERFYLKQTPTSSYDNTDVRYKYELEFVSERIILETTLFYDVVLDSVDSEVEDVAYVTSNTKFQFYGTIHEFVQRLNASLIVSGLSFRVESKDDGVNSDGKMVSFEDKFIAEALQEIYNTYQYPYYYDVSRKTFVVGHNEATIVDENNNETIFEYGSDKNLVSITKTNANHKLVNRITGYGSEDNIPYYYPNETPKGVLMLTNSANMDGKLSIKDKKLFAKKVDLNEEVEYKLLVSPTENEIINWYQWGGPKKINGTDEYWYSRKEFYDADGNFVQYEQNKFDGCYGWEFLPIKEDVVITLPNGETIIQNVSWRQDGARVTQKFKLKFDLIVKGSVGTHMRLIIGIPQTFIDYKERGLFSTYMIGCDPIVKQTHHREIVETRVDRSESSTQVFLDFSVFQDDESKDGKVECFVDFTCFTIGGESIILGGSVDETDLLTRSNWQGWLRANFEVTNKEAVYGWAGKHLESSDINRFGLEYLDDFDPNKDPEYWSTQGLWFGQEKDPNYPYITPQTNLMPSIYRETYGRERFYNAEDNKYEIPEGLGGGIDDDGNHKQYMFSNPYGENYPKEHIQGFEDIKPTIQGIKNSRGQLFNEIIDVAFDEDDNNEIDEGGKYLHPHFYVKLPKYDGEHGFNLFEHAIDESHMTISMLNGMCGGCEFEIGVTQDGQKNPVQIYKDENGKVSLVRDNAGNVVHGTPQKEQNNTKENEVWIALKKDASSFNQAMPDSRNRVIPKTGDSFVILHIELPEQYITAAEDRLEKELIQYMYENNIEKFTFSMKFSRIYLAEHETVLRSLDENASIKVKYEGREYLLYASSYTYKMSGKDLIPEISIDISDTITTNQSAIQKAISPIQADIANRIESINFVERCSPYFLRKDINDTAYGKIHLSNGATIDGEIASNDFRQSLNGLGIFKDESGLWHVESDYLRVRKTMYVEKLDIATTSSENGQKYLTSANGNIDFVIETNDAYRCYFLKTDTSGKNTINKWRIGDQAYHLMYNLGKRNASGIETTSKYYWRKVVGVSNGDESGEISINGIVYFLNEYHYIDLSKKECAEGSDIPRINDNIVQLGYQGDDAPERQNAIVLAGAGDGSPYVRLFEGINSFHLPEPETQLKPGDNILSGKTKFKTHDDSEKTLGDLGEETKKGLEEIKNLEYGVNIIRNSGFVGNYDTKELWLGDILSGTEDNDSELFSPSLESWSTRYAKTEKSEDSASGTIVVVNKDGYLEQTLYYAVEEGANYILSWKGKGGGLSYEVGGVQGFIDMNDTFAPYHEKFTAIQSGSILRIYLYSKGELCELSLLRGTIPTNTWEASPFDNRQEFAKYESLSYLQNLLRADTIIDGGVVSTGVVNTGLINMGHYDENGKMMQVTAGMSGTWNNDDSVAFFGGGDLAKAIYTVQKYKENPNYEPTTEELASMAKAVITHGGRAILQDIILRGYVYAEGGVFRGKVYADGGEFNGTVNAKDGVFNGMLQGASEYGSVQMGISNDTEESKRTILSITSPLLYSDGKPVVEQGYATTFSWTQDEYGGAGYTTLNMDAFSTSAKFAAWYAEWSDNSEAYNGVKTSIRAGTVRVSSEQTQESISMSNVSLRVNDAKVELYTPTIQVDINKLPTEDKKDTLVLGQLYRDGDTLKIKT